MSNQPADANDTRPLVLHIEDELGISMYMQSGLSKEGFRVETAQDGPSGLAKARMLRPDVIILDLALPGIDGLSVCRQLRADPSTADLPILMLTARESVSDLVLGLETGADDYLTKSSAFEELVARLRVILRRQQRLNQGGITGRTLRFDNLELNEATREVHRGERPVNLTATEFSLLQLFMLHPRQVLDRQTILDRVWGYDFGGETNIIEVYVRYLREKLEDDPSAPKLIQTVRGVGYVLRGA